MAYKRYLTGTEREYAKGLEPDEFKELGYKENKKGKLFQKTPTFDGKPLDQYLATDHDYYDDMRSGVTSLGRGRTKTPISYHTDAMVGVGPRADFLGPLHAHGISISDMPSLAREAELVNVNSMSDLEQIIAAHNARYTSESELEEALKDMQPAQPKEPALEDEPEIAGYTLSPELDAAITRNRDFGRLRMAGDIYGDSVPGSVDLDSDPNSDFLYDFADGMRERLRNYRNA